MKLYISTEMLAVFSLREVELSRRIHCFPTGERERFHSILSPLPFVFHHLSSSSSLQFPATHTPFFYRLLFRAAFPRASFSVLGRIAPRRDELGRARVKRGSFPRPRFDCETGVFLRERTWHSIEQKYARNSTQLSLDPQFPRQIRNVPLLLKWNSRARRDATRRCA